jgi:hypothetical protein
MADRVIMLPAVDANHDPVAGAEARFYLAGTTTEATVYATADGTTVLSQPVTADSAGIFETAVYATAALKIDVTDPADDTSLPGYPNDEWYIVPANAGTAGSITFSPITGNAATNVQTALSNVQTQLDAKQASDAQLAALAALTPASNKVPRFTALETADLLDFLDEDDMASNSATALVSQQSLVAYVAAQMATVIGFGQTWGDYSGSRVANGTTVYQNTTDRPIMIAISTDSSTGGDKVEVSPDNVTWVTVATYLDVHAQVIVPINHYYRAYASGTLQTWAELR